MFTVFAAEEFNPHTVCQSTPCQGKNTDILSFYSWKPVSHYRVTVLVTCKVLQKKPKRIGELMRLIHYQLITVFSLYQSRIQNSFSLHYSLEEFNKILDVRCKLGESSTGIQVCSYAFNHRCHFKVQIQKRNHPKVRFSEISQSQSNLLLHLPLGCHYLFVCLLP